jgi:hypothetical protein
MTLPWRSGSRPGCCGGSRNAAITSGLPWPWSMFSPKNGLGCWPKMRPWKHSGNGGQSGGRSGKQRRGGRRLATHREANRCLLVLSLPTYWKSVVLRESQLVFDPPPTQKTTHYAQNCTSPLFSRCGMRVDIPFFDPKQAWNPPRKPPLPPHWRGSNAGGRSPISGGRSSRVSRGFIPSTDGAGAADEVRLVTRPAPRRCGSVGGSPRRLRSTPSRTSQRPPTQRPTTTRSFKHSETGTGGRPRVGLLRISQILTVFQAST